MHAIKTNLLALVIFFGALLAGFGAEKGRTELHGHVPSIVPHLTARGHLASTNDLTLAIGLPLRNENELDALIQQLYDPHSLNFHKYLSTAEFTERFGPTKEDYLALQEFARTNGFVIIGTHPNRLVLEVQGKSGDAERAFHVTLHKYKDPSDARDFFGPDTEPSVPDNLSVADVWGLSDYPRAVRHSHPARPRTGQPLAGSATNGWYMGNDFRNAYAPGTTLNGAGQSVGLLEFSDYFAADITSYESIIGLATNVPVNTVLVRNPAPSTTDNEEVALDIEVAIAMAPGLSQVLVYEIQFGSSSPSSILNRMANDNIAKQLSSSWTWSGGPSATVDNALKQMITQGQSFFQAAGDSDAYTGAAALDNASQTTAPVSSTNVICVGGTTLTMSGAGVAWSSEKVWNYAAFGGSVANVGTGGGISTYYKIPYWQTNVSMALNSGSTTFRNIPDVALTADGIFVMADNGSPIGLAGTSCAAPLWAGFTALINQQSTALGSSSVGFINPAIYAISKGSSYNSCFHDITTGNNIGTNTAGLFNAVANYDLCTGLGTPNGTNLINALAPALPFFYTQPASRNVTNGTTVALITSVNGVAPLNFQWLLNGTNLPAVGNISGTTTNVLTITTATTNNIGNYSLVVMNSYGAVTSSVAVLNVGFPPTIVTPPGSLTALTGSNVVFSTTAGGTVPFSFQWRKSGTNIANGAGISGATSNVLTLSSVTTNTAGNYSVFVTNTFGIVTSSVATLTVVLPPGITASSLTNRTLECGSNISYSVTTSGTTPLFIQWSVDGSPVAGATNASVTLTNVHLPNHTVTAVVTNIYASFTSNATLTVNDTLAPVITLNGNSRLTNELGSTFIDPGASANDTCAGPVAVATNGVVNTAVVGTNTLTYKATDGNGNTNAVTRTVVIRDTTPPVITWSFTNLVVAAGGNCSALMTNVTGTNFILASDLSGALTITQNPTNNAVLALGTNVVVITVADASGNKSFSTNRIIVADQTPPVIALNGGAVLTNQLGSAFVDPGVTASDTCAGIVSVTTNGAVNVNAVATNTLTYTATDASGNTNAVTRTVIVRDTAPPTILWSFTNLVLSLDTNCSAIMPDVLGTNYIIATDLSGPLIMTQSPSKNTSLLLGTNSALISVTDAYGNTAVSTNQIVVLDTALPLIVSQPQSQVNLGGTTASFNVAATACTPVTFQWLFNNAALTLSTNSTLTLSNLTAGNAGNYSVAVTSAGGSITSAVATLTVNFVASSIALVSSSNPDGFKDSLNFTATVMPTNAPGTVQFLTNGAAFDAEPLVAGLATSTNLTTLPRGTNLIAAIYSGGTSNLPATNSFVQVVTNHPPVVLPAAYSLIAGMSLNIAVTNLATNWSDVDGDSLSITAIAPSTNGVVVTNATPMLYYANPNYVDDQFVCTVSDGFGGTNFQTVSIFVVPQTNSAPAIASVSSQPSGLSLKLTGAYGSTYILESRTDMVSGAWMPVATNILDVTGVWQFTDTRVTNFPNQFYRLKLQP